MPESEKTEQSVSAVPETPSPPAQAPAEGAVPQEGPLAAAAPEPGPAAEPVQPYDALQDPRVRQLLEQASQGAYQQGEQAAQVARTSQEMRERLGKMSDEELGQFVRQQQAQQEVVAAAQTQVGKALAQKIWQDLCQIPEFQSLPQEEQAQIFWQPEGGNPYVAAARAIAGKALEKLVKEKADALVKAEVNKRLAEAHRTAPVVAPAATAPGSSAPSDWDSLFAEKDRQRGLR